MSGKRTAKLKQKTAEKPAKVIAKEPSKAQISAKTTDKAKLHEEKPWLFKPGNKLGGRPKGSRNLLGEKFLSDLLNDWEEHGAMVLAEVRENDPTQYVKVVASILPREIKLENEDATLDAFLDQFKSVEEIDAFIRGVEAIGTSASPSGSEEAQAEASHGVKSNVLH
jgi:hypothetical protein